MHLRFVPHLAMLLSCASIGCSDLGDPRQPMAVDDAAISFARDVQPIFNARCVVCHGAVNPLPAGLDLRAGNSYAHLVGRTSTGYAPNLRVSPGDTLASVIYGKITGTNFGEQMPPGFFLIPPSERDRIVAWILAGAPNN
ncbi:MAG: cytochrome c [Candidatus Latescibacteria bacterium]|nr:cytochrome c [Candidatus Latescibacterota bacterium]